MLLYETGQLWPGVIAIGACAVGGPDNRPVMGAVNICSTTFHALSQKRQVEVLVHELLHAFVSEGGRVGGVSLR